MPRIRTIKPEFCTSEQLAECSTSARLLFATMWCFCDDAGRHTRSPLRLKAECFPFDPFTRDEMETLILELIAVELLVEYEYEGKAYLQVTGWHHQRIDRPNYKFPPFDEYGKPAPIDDYSTTIRRTVDERSPSDHPRIGKEGKGKERKGEGGAIDDKSPTPPAPAPDLEPTTPTEGETPTPKAISRQPPPIEDIRALFAELGQPDQAEAFRDHYAANGWVQGRGKPIRDWSAAARNWVRRENEFGRGRGGGRGGKVPGFEEVMG
jgi:hypothetical protein